MSFNSLLFHNIEIKRNTNEYFNGQAGASVPVTFTGRGSHVVITNALGSTAAITFTGKKNGITVTELFNLLGFDVDFEGTQEFDELINFVAVPANATTICVNLVNPRGEPVDKIIDVVTTRANVRIRDSFTENEVSEPGQFYKTEAKVSVPPEAGILVQRKDFFDFEGSTFQIRRIKEIFSCANVTHHYEFIAGEIDR